MNILMIYSVNNDEIIVDVFQDAGGIRTHKLELVNRPSISVFIEENPIVGTLSRLHSL